MEKRRRARRARLVVVVVVLLCLEFISFIEFIKSTDCFIIICRFMLILIVVLDIHHPEKSFFAKTTPLLPFSPEMPMYRVFHDGRSCSNYSLSTPLCEV
jgi:hypothetical protein